MRRWTVSAGLLVVALLSVGCDPASRYKVLSFVFDGVPTPRAPEPTPAPGAVAVATPGLVRYREHGPYAARMCNACHQTGASNVLVEPADQLCFKCHDLRLNKKFIHGPLASGGCIVCHDPHSSQYPYLLVSDSVSASFCLHCHDRQTVAKIPAHAGIGDQPCTTCHDPHMSDKRYLLR